MDEVQNIQVGDAVIAHGRMRWSERLTMRSGQPSGWKRRRPGGPERTRNIHPVRDYEASVHGFTSKPDETSRSPAVPALAYPGAPPLPSPGVPAQYHNAGPTLRRDDTRAADRIVR